MKRRKKRFEFFRAGFPRLTGRPARLPAVGQYSLSFSGRDGDMSDESLGTARNPCGDLGKVLNLFKHKH